MPIANKLQYMNVNTDEYNFTVGSFEELDSSKKRFIDLIEKNLFQNTIKAYYGIESLSNNNLEIFTGLDLYRRVKIARNNKRAVRKRFDAYMTVVFRSDFCLRGGEVIR